MGNSRGLTIIELIIVAAIVGILTLVSVPTFKGMGPALRVNAAARALATEMQSARMRAVTRRASYQVQFDTTNYKFTVCTDQDTNGSITCTISCTTPDANGLVTCTADNVDVIKICDAKGSITCSDQPVGNVVLKVKDQQTVVFGFVSGTKDTQGDPIPSAVTFSADRVTFRPFGTADKNGTVYLMPSADLATGRKDRMRAITVLLQTGRVKLWKCNALCNSGASWSPS